MTDWTPQAMGRKGGLSRKHKYRPSRRKAQAMARASHAARERKMKEAVQEKAGTERRRPNNAVRVK